MEKSESAFAVEGAASPVAEFVGHHQRNALCEGASKRPRSPNGLALFVHADLAVQELFVVRRPLRVGLVGRPAELGVPNGLFTAARQRHQGAETTGEGSEARILLFGRAGGAVGVNVYDVEPIATA